MKALLSGKEEVQEQKVIHAIRRKQFLQLISMCCSSNKFNLKYVIKQLKEKQLISLRSKHLKFMMPKSLNPRVTLIMQWLSVANLTIDKRILIC
jgi:hypothetical protein